MPPLLDVRGLTVEFPAGAGLAPAGNGAAASRMVTAVRDVSFRLDAGEVLGLVGESGSGKSVTSLAIMRLLPPQARAAGQVLLEGEDLLGLPAEPMRLLRGSRLAMIFQEPMTALNPVMRVGDQVAEAWLVHQRNGTRRGLFGARAARGHAAQVAVEALEAVGIPEPERRSRDYPHQLSGGMRQRVMIAMAIVNRPQLLIADEPTTALDVTIQAQILELLADLRRRFDLAMLFISHDLAVVSRVSDRVAVMYAGHVVEMGAAQELFAHPVHPYTRGLIHSAPSLHTDRSRPLPTIEGSVPAPGTALHGCPFEPRCALRVPDCARVLPPLVEVAPGHFARCPISTELKIEN